MKYSSVRHINRAQHKRPGATARRERQQTALERLWVSKNVQTSRAQEEIATLKRRLGTQITEVDSEIG